VLVSELNRLIEHLSNWRTSDDWDSGSSLRDNAITRLTEIGPDAVPSLTAKLQQLLDDRADYLARFTAAKAEFDAWRADFIGPEPTGLLELRGHRDPYELRQGLVEALRALADQRATPVLVAALRDQACVWYAAMALRDIRAAVPVDALMDGLVITVPNGRMTKEIAAVAVEYGVTPEQVIARFDAEETEQGRVNLIELLGALAAEREVPATAFLAAIDDQNEKVRWAVTDGLTHVAASPEVEATLLVMALDQEESVRWRAISALREVRGGGTSVGGSHNFPLTEDLVREAFLLQDERVDVRVRGRLADLRDPMPVVRALHRLAADGDRQAGAALLAGEALFHLMLADETAEEAKAAFDTVATPPDVTRFEQFRAARPKPQPKRRRWLRRR
jgi:HEAT repeat protein